MGHPHVVWTTSHPPRRFFCAIVCEMYAGARGWLALALLSLVSTRLLSAQEPNVPTGLQKLDPQKPGFTGYPPMTYDHVFLSCPSDGACTRTDKFRVDPMPHGCCILTVRNGDGRGTDQVHSYEIFLNGKRVASNSSQYANAPVKLRGSNTIRVALSGGPQSKLSVMISYDPRHSK